MTHSIRALPGSPAADRRTPQDDPTPVPDPPPSVNVAVLAAIAGLLDGGARVHNARAALRGAAAAGHALAALARYVRMKLTDEADLSGDEADGTDAIRTPWGEFGFAVVSTGRAAGEAGQAKRPRASDDRSAVAIGATAPIAPVRAGAPVHRLDAPRGSTALRIIGWGVWLAAVVVLASTLWLVVLALKRAVDDMPGSTGAKACERAPRSCKK